MKSAILIMLTLLFCGLGACKSTQSSDENGDLVEDKRCLEKPRENCICTRQYAPVCGCNGKTYGNACEAECNGIVTYSVGECSK